MITRRDISVTIIIFFVLFCSVCGKKSIEAGSPEEVLLFIREKGNTELVMDLYTGETINLMKKYMKLTGMKKETSTDILSFIPEGAEYTLSDKKMDGDRCSLNIVFTSHKSENSIGQIISVLMVKNGNIWKIDRSEDFKKLIDSYEKKGAEVYLNKIR